MTTKTTSTSVSAAEMIATTATSTNTRSDNIIKTKIENATEGLHSTCFNYLFNRMLPAYREGKYLENKDESECGLHYDQNSLEYLMWMLSLIGLSWMIGNLKAKTEVGSCHTIGKILKNLVL